MMGKLVFSSLYELVLSKWEGCKALATPLGCDLKIPLDYLSTADKGTATILWELSRARLLELNLTTEFALLDCGNEKDNSWAFRLLHKRGYCRHQQAMEVINDLHWGCIALEKIDEVTTDLVSVIVPTHNSAPYLEQCLESILNQSHKNIEVILVDDASTDNTVQVARNILLADTERQHYIIQLPKHINAGAVRQVGIDEAVGDFICCFDSDDAMPKLYLERALEAFEEDIDFVYPRQWFLIPDYVFKNFSAYYASTPDIDVIMKEWETQDVAWRGIVYQSNNACLFQNSSDPSASKLGSCMIISTVCRASAEPKFDAKLSRLQDWDMHLDLLSRGKKGKGFFCAPDIRERSNSITTGTGRAVFESSRDYVIAKHNLPKLPKTLILPLNSGGGFEKTLSGPRIRGVNLQPHLHNSELGDLDTLRYQWQKYDVFYFVCAPTPLTVGWAQHLTRAGKLVLFDICVEYWGSDYKFEGYSVEDFQESIKALGRAEVTFITPSWSMKLSLTNFMGYKDVEVIADSIMPTQNLKTSYASRGSVCWCGCSGNLPELLNFTRELTELTEEAKVVVRLITDQQPFRLPFKWEWREWNLTTEEQFITETDVYLLPRIGCGSYNHKGIGKEALASILGMPIVTMKPDNSWVETLYNLLQSQSERKKDGINNLSNALQKFITPLSAARFTEIVHDRIAH